jgi:hypothetical protein
METRGEKIRREDGRQDNKGEEERRSRSRNMIRRNGEV